MNLPVGKGRPARKADNLTAICEPAKKMWEPQCLTTVWASTACYGDNFTFFYLFSDLRSKLHNEEIHNFNVSV
jgi:hypothetical protein